MRAARIMIVMAEQSTSIIHNNSIYNLIKLLFNKLIIICHFFDFHDNHGRSLSGLIMEMVVRERSTSNNEVGLINRPK